MHHSDLKSGVPLQLTEEPIAFESCGFGWIFYDTDSISNVRLLSFSLLVMIDAEGRTRRRKRLAFTFSKLAFVLTCVLVLVPWAALQLFSARPRGVAVCIAGNARTFHYNFTHESLLHLVVDRLRENYETDVLFILRTDDQPTATRLASEENFVGTRLAVRKFAPSVVKWITDKNELQLEESRYVPMGLTLFERIRPPFFCSSDCHPMRFPHTLFRSRQCAHEIQRQEKLRAAPYAWIYRLRPDVVFPDGLPLPRDLESNIVYTNQGRPRVTEATGYRWRLNHWFSTPVADGPVADVVNFGARRVVMEALSAYDAVNHCDVFESEITNGPESLLRFWLLEQRIKWEAVPFDWIIIRGQSGPECERLEYQNGTGADPIRSMNRCVQFAQRFREHFPLMKFDETELAIQHVYVQQGLEQERLRAEREYMTVI